MRVLAVLEDVADPSKRRVVVAFPALRILPTRDGIDLERLGHCEIIGAALIRRSPQSGALPGEALFELVVRPDK
jgi:hypothetical protein